LSDGSIGCLATVCFGEQVFFDSQAYFPWQQSSKAPETYKLHHGRKRLSLQLVTPYDPLMSNLLFRVM